MPSVVFVSPHSDPQADLGEQDSGGQCVYEDQLAQALSHLGWKVSTFCRQTGIMEKYWKLEHLSAHFPNVWGLVDDDIDTNLLVNTTYRGKLFLLGKTGQLRESVFQPQVVSVADWGALHNWIAGHIHREITNC